MLGAGRTDRYQEIRGVGDGRHWTRQVAQHEQQQRFWCVELDGHVAIAQARQGPGSMCHDIPLVGII